jgi:hypothetical protein
MLSKHDLKSLVIIFCAASLLYGCATVSHSTSMDPYAFNYVAPADTRHYVMMNDSSIVYGKKVVGWSLGVFSKKNLHIDGRPVNASEILGFQNKEGFWAKLEDDAVARRLITGRISVYRRFIELSNGARVGRIYFQKNAGPIREISGREELKRMMQECPKAFDMLNISGEEYTRILKKEPYYLQSVIEIYNKCL